MKMNKGASVPDQALAVPVEPVARLDPSGFDPSRVASPPELPPFLRSRRKRRDDEPFIMPDFLRIETQSRVFDRANNWITIHYTWMNRVWGFFDRCEIAHVNSRRYRQWLETYPLIEGVPPHIQFGGAIEVGKGDPTFYSRWLIYARREFC